LSSSNHVCRLWVISRFCWHLTRMNNS
jgi:hypothetical protein